MNVSKFISDWFYQRTTFRLTDEVVVQAARRGNVFMTPSDHVYEVGPSSADYIRVYEFKYGLLKLRMTRDRMMEIVANAPNKYGGGCMYPPMSEWAMTDAVCGQGYRVSQTNLSEILSRVTEVSEWLVDAQSVFEEGKLPNQILVSNQGLKD